MRRPPYRWKRDFLPERIETPSPAQICAAWDAIEEAEPYISPELLAARTIDHFRGVIDEGHIAAALAGSKAEGDAR